MSYNRPILHKNYGYSPIFRSKSNYIR